MVFLRVCSVSLLLHLRSFCSAVLFDDVVGGDGAGKYSTITFFYCRVSLLDVFGSRALYCRVNTSVHALAKTSCHLK